MTKKDPDAKFQSRIAKIIILALLFGLIIWLSIHLKILLFDLVLAVTVAGAMAPLANRLEKRGVPRVVTVVGLYAIVFGFYTIVALLLAQPIKEQATLLVQQFPVYLDGLTNEYNLLMSRLGLQSDSVSFNLADWRNLGMSIVQRTYNITAGLFGMILNGLLVLFLAGYFVASSKSILGHLLLWVPPEHRERTKSLIEPLSNRMGGYIRGQALVSTAVATILSIGLSLIGLKYGLVLGLLAGILNLVPFVGSFLTAAVAVVVAFNQSITMVVLTVAVFAVEQALESNFLTPYLLGRQVDLHPLVVLFAVLIGATLGGALGALVAVPLTAAGVYLAQEFYLKPLNNGNIEPEAL